MQNPNLTPSALNEVLEVLGDSNLPLPEGTVFLGDTAPTAPFDLDDAVTHTAAVMGTSERDVRSALNTAERVLSSSKAPDGSTLDEYLEKARTNPHAETRSTPRPGSQQARSNEPSPLEIEVRNFLSAMNRDERRNWLARQRIAAGKVRKNLFTVGKTK